MLIDAQGALEHLDLSMKVQTSLHKKSLDTVESAFSTLLDGLEENSSKIRGKDDRLGNLIDLIA